MNSLLTEDGTLVETQDAILKETTNFYKRLYTSERTDDFAQDYLLNNLKQTLTDEREREREREREMFYLTTHSTHFIYGYMASDIWSRTILIVRKETRCRHIGYSYRLTAMVLLYAPFHRQDNTYHGLCYTSNWLEREIAQFN